MSTTGRGMNTKQNMRKIRLQVKSIFGVHHDCLGKKSQVIIGIYMDLYSDGLQVFGYYQLGPLHYIIEESEFV